MFYFRLKKPGYTEFSYWINYWYLLKKKRWDMNYTITFFILFILFSTGCNNFVEPNPEFWSRLKQTSNENGNVYISFKNNSEYLLKDLIISDRLIGSLESGSSSRFVAFESFRFDTGMPDENASAIVGEKIVNNHHRNYWCGTEKLTVDSGKYLIEVEVSDTTLFLSCDNAPTIFD